MKTTSPTHHDTAPASPAPLLRGVMLGLAMALVTVPLSGCHQRTPAEKVEDTMKDTGETIKDAVSPDDPATETMEKVEETVEKATGN